MADSLASRFSITGIPEEFHGPRQLSRSAPRDGNHPNRSTILKYRLRYAAKGVPTSPAKTKEKRPALKGWQALATTDPRRIHAEFNDRTLPDYDGILTPTGAKYGRLVLDVDSLSDLERLEEAIGVKLRGISTEVQTPRGVSMHVHFLWPDEAEIPNSVGKHARDGFEGIDLRGEGGLVLLPPSRGYRFANALPTAPAPPELVEWATKRKKEAAPPAKNGSESRRGPASANVAGPPIPYGSRWATLQSIAGKLHDGTRNLGQLTDDLEAINAARCLPRFGDHPTDRPDELTRIARLVYKTDPCRPRGKPDSEFEVLMEQANRGWYERFLLGGDSKSTIRDTVRACLGSIAKRREVRTITRMGGEKVRVLVFAESTRELELLTRSSACTVSNHLRQMQEEGLLVVLHRPPAGRTTYGLVPGAHWFITPHQPFSFLGRSEALVWTDKVLRAHDLSTPMFGWFSHLSNAMRRILCIIEAFGAQSTEELNGVLGPSRLRDLEGRQLRPLEGMGLLQVREGWWDLPDDYLERMEALADEQYSTTYRRRRRSRDGQRVVTDVVEATVMASERERDALREARQALDRAAYAARLEEKLEEDERCRELLNARDEERGANGSMDELERLEGPERPWDGRDRDARPPRSRRSAPGDPKQRVERLVYEGVSRCWAQAEVYGGEDVLGVGT